MARPKALLFAGVEIRWKCAPELIGDDTPAEAVFQFPGGLADHLKEQIGTRECATAEPFVGRQEFPGEQGRSEEHTSELQSLMRISYVVLCRKNNISNINTLVVYHSVISLTSLTTMIHVLFSSTF